jgi:uncharacterized membrane protein YfcA
MFSLFFMTLFMCFLVVDMLCGAFFLKRTRAATSTFTSAAGRVATGLGGGVVGVGGTAGALLLLLLFNGIGFNESKSFVRGQ